MKSMKKFVANGFKSCGIATAIISLPRCLLVVVGVGGWRGYEWWQAKQAAEIRHRF